jgi:hypothetical protein
MPISLPRMGGEETTSGADIHADVSGDPSTFSVAGSLCPLGDASLALT